MHQNFNTLYNDVVNRRINLFKPSNWARALAPIENKWWLALMIVAIIGVILMIVNTYAFYTVDGDAASVAAQRPVWKEYVIFPYFFTFISNVTAIIVPIIVLASLARLSSKHLQRYKVMMATNLLLTLIVYWALLAREADWTNTYSTVQTVIVHAVTPLLAIITFCVDARFNSSARTIRIKSTLALNIIMPLAWLAFALIMYVILGAGGVNDAPYGFLNVAHNPWYMSVAYIAGIGLGYLLITLLFTLIWKQAWLRLRRRQ